MRKILNKCRGKFECLNYEMLNFKKEKETDSEHRENDSISAKLFIQILLILLFIPVSFILMYFLTHYFLYNVH